MIAEELGIHPVELDRLNYKVRSVWADDDTCSGYEFILTGDNPQEIVDKINGLENGIALLSASLLDAADEALYDYPYEPVCSTDYHYLIFVNELDSLAKLNDVKLDSDKMNNILKRQIHIGLIALMECYLQDTFTSLVFQHKLYLEKFVTTHPDFSKRKFELRDVFEQYRTIEETVRTVIRETIYHDLPKVRQMYRSTFVMDFPDIKDVITCVKTRHDLVHRNGTTKAGYQITLSSYHISESISIISKFVTQINSLLNVLEDPDTRFGPPDTGDLPF